MEASVASGLKDMPVTGLLGRSSAERSGRSGQPRFKATEAAVAAAAAAASGKVSLSLSLSLSLYVCAQANLSRTLHTFAR